MANVFGKMGTLAVTAFKAANNSKFLKDMGTKAAGAAVTFFTGKILKDVFTKNEKTETGKKAVTVKVTTETEAGEKTIIDKKIEE